MAVDTRTAERNFNGDGGGGVLKTRAGDAGGGVGGLWGHPPQKSLKCGRKNG